MPTTSWRGPPRSSSAQNALPPLPVPPSLGSFLRCSPNSPAIVRRDVGSLSSDMPRRASIHGAERTQPAALSRPPLPAISAARPPPSLPDPRPSSCRRPQLETGGICIKLSPIRAGWGRSSVYHEANGDRQHEKDDDG